VHVLGHMTGPTVRTLIPEKKLAGVIPGSTVIPVLLALSFVKGTVRKVTVVSLLMEFLSVGSILTGTGLSRVRMEPTVAGVCVFSHTRRISYGY